MKQLILLSVCIFLSTIASALEIDKTVFAGYDAAFVMVDRASGETVNIDPVRSAQRLSPCSTFKIYNTLIGLELGLIPGADAPWYTWDGVTRDIEGWNQNLTLREAFKVSSVPAYQMLARQIGPERMKSYIDQIAYGTQDISGGIDTFWLPREGQTSIAISADEQVVLLRKLLDGEMPFAPKNVAILKDVMLYQKTDKGTLYGKTGSGMSADGKWNLGWFVGFVESQGKAYVFACNIQGGEKPFGPTARGIVENILKSNGLF